MKRWWWIGLGVVLVAVLAIWAQVHRQSLVPPVKWETKNPIVNPSKTRQIALSQGVQDRTKMLSLPSGHLLHTDWYLPITSHSEVTYVIHDGQARWIFDGHIIALPNAPTDPVGHLLAAPNGKELAWNEAQGVFLVHSDKSTQVIPHAINAYFTPHNVLDYIKPDGTLLKIYSPFPTRVLSGSTHFGYQPFVQDGHSLVYDHKGQINLLSLATGSQKPILRVRATRWPELADSISYGSHIAILLRRPSPLPAYLLAIKTNHGLLWYRWKTGLKPQIGLSQGHLVINNLDPSGQLVILGKKNLHPLPQSTGLFSQSSQGVIFQTNQGFTLLSQIQ